MPFNMLKEWLNKEKERGIEDPSCAVLSTCSSSSEPHSRVVAIREIETESLLFFTQQKTRKVAELLNNPKSCLNFLFAMQNRQVILEGTAIPISQEENEAFWSTLPRERQLRFSAYAPTSGLVIKDLNQLETRKKELSDQFAGLPIPMSEYYFGFRFIPETWIFYTVGSISFSEVIRYTKIEDSWKSELISP
ncbi:TPA: pyridoxamine 5'-phosphate oxidase family protein [Legionella pneumophila]|uniref:Pyridoxamine 5'-phosphate oxidase family protein n=2 Tax=Legionella bononiensis TaxID=2793102 RepID=A0ABS1WEN4_9GAMM|nr:MULTISPECIES: pyridoxamine 5'-phosphate oxidase family protein [Legionellaceae]ERI46785.1 pyridoxamine 5'-phosphate oxidase [Legionella pneumophila str. Leg01/20]MBL7527800.1 pyridoxamine 5'-phosphate oxidase family protein [Legionella bononiensis]HAT8857977.1 pyridoxamine 5'-phosphate oxidase [Legionella pneumophila subsp. pneumophila]KTD12253.1 pyridoxamine 5'-phosphate oxidase [Legionella hackeliae]MBL7563758.1 pyridoxamine 5'-phosphate oxidase family protein [Legionella bononiensis]